MKRISLIAALTCIAGLFFAGSALAASTGTLNVTANVTDSCAITGGTLAFGNLDPTNPVAVTANSAGVTVTCTNGNSTYSVTDNLTAEAGNLSDGSGNNIPYSISYPTTMPTMDGTAKTLTITGTIAANTYATSPAGSYTDSVTLTVNP